MSLKQLRPYLLLAAVLFGQWLGLAHAAQHDSLAPHETLCAYCASGIGSAPPPATSSSLPLARHGVEAPQAAAPVFLAALQSGPARIRGPPSLFV